MLWWGVMTIVGVGWFLLAPVFFVVVIVGVGGQAVLTLSRRVGVVPPPPAPVQPQRAVLSPTELDRLQLVVYIPDANDPPPVDPSNCPTLPVDVTRLAYPPIYLSTHETTCVTCQETFIPPREGNAIMLKADPLGLLGCGHVFYLSTEYSDQWLLVGSGNCPFCYRSVRDTWDEKAKRTGMTSVTMPLVSLPAEGQRTWWRRRQVEEAG